MVAGSSDPIFRFLSAAPVNLRWIPVGLYACLAILAGRRGFALVDRYDRTATSGWTAAVVTTGAAVMLLEAPSTRFAGVAFVLAVAVALGPRSHPMAAPLVLVAGAVLSLFTFLWGQHALAQFVIMYTLFSSVLSLVVRLVQEENRRQAALLDQARWSASQYARANTRLQDDVFRAHLFGQSAERTRIAREVHDTVGHTLTAVLVQLKAAREELKVDPSRLAERLESLENTVRSVSQEVRAEVSRLRNAQAREENWRERWTRMCRLFSENTGIRVNTNIDERLRDVGDEIGENLYRVIQEGITNAYRHGKASYVDVSAAILSEEGRLVLRISDNGVGADRPRMGNGLAGMRERVTALGGRFAWQTMPSRGFDLGVVLPWREHGG